MEIIKDFIPTKVLGRVDKFEMEDFIKNHAEEMVKVMQKYRLPYLHCAQVGLEYNIAFMSRNNQMFAIINPRFTPARSSKKRTIQEASFSHIISEPPNILTAVFETERHMTVRGMYDVYTEKGQLVPDSDKFENGEAVIIQALCDISQGKSITRFPVYLMGITDEQSNG